MTLDPTRRAAVIAAIAELLAAKARRVAAEKDVALNAPRVESAASERDATLANELWMVP